jgi:ABC-type molybdenum transport system ATPase subunit/photorepair protein PhrA
LYGSDSPAESSGMSLIRFNDVAVRFENTQILREAFFRLETGDRVGLIGRNGSGKSSFAEALEFAITGSSYRWENKAKLWADTWRHYIRLRRMGQTSWPATGIVSKSEFALVACHG